MFVVMLVLMVMGDGGVLTYYVEGGGASVVRFEISGGYVCVAADTFRAAHKLGHQNLRCARTVHLSPRLGRKSACTE